MFLVVACTATAAIVVGWSAWNLYRERLITGCQATTLAELESALGRPSAITEEERGRCWHYRWAWGVYSWCSSDGVNVVASDGFIE
jgi:hypothetical protein